MTAQWWEDLTPQQAKGFRAFVDARVRLLGEDYGRAVEQVRASDDARDYILGLEAATR